ncbi:AhpC/TSA family protein [Ferruginibacter sp. HRS2-29]|uniref:AhpC/TSA family protein n=1 Tax=Ferruginibacter sp. HRS2-29 TaxID=2487334 RepID=UPI0020CEAC69|nr:AhpC/TSA family protein [Ferruginibacter sp. HRS2-29]MCP9752615.1 DUF4369 domain-containing protein [Ferruginibacter sp. HRS2-29]
MTNLKKLNLLFIFLLSSALAMAQTFNITGTTKGIEDGTLLYLRTSSSETILDSAKVTANRFHLVGNTNDKISHMIIYTTQYKNYIFFWAEQNTHLELKNGEFKKAFITGSKTQDEENTWSKIKEPNGKLQDSLTHLITITKADAGKKELKKRLDAARKTDQELDMNYVMNHPNSLISVYLLDVYTSTWGKDKAALLYNNLSPEMKNTSYGKNIQDFISLNKEIKIGGQFVDFEQSNVNGKLVRLSGIKAKYILVEFWGSWCSPCREENPNLVAIYNVYKSKGFEILGVSADNNKNQWLKAIKDDRLPWENVSDLKGDKNVAALIYGIIEYPTNYLINDKGIIIAKNLRGQNLKKKLAELLP